MLDTEIGESGLSTLVAVVQVDQEGRYALSPDTDLLRIVRQAWIDEVEMGCSLLSGLVMEHRRGFEVTQRNPATCGHASLYQEVQDGHVEQTKSGCRVAARGTDGFPLADGIVYP